MSVLARNEMSRITYLIWDFGVDKTLHLLEEALTAQTNVFLAEYCETPESCPACGNPDMLDYEQYKSLKCSLCGYVHNYAKNTLDKA